MKTIARSLLMLALALAFAFSFPGLQDSMAQDKGAQDQSAKGSETDPISQQATKLEGDLGKFKETSPDAAEVMLKLVNLYHEHGRVLGLIRVANTFSSAQAGDPRHHDVMLKLMDGLEIMSRNNDLVIACRQFLVRYPKSPQRTQVQIRLARTLAETDELEGSADAHSEVWKQQGPNAFGIAHGLDALTIYLDRLRGKHTATGAELGQEMLARMPKNDVAREVGQRSFNAWRQASQYAKSNLVAQQLLQHKLIKDREELRQLHSLIAENHSSLGQYRNALASLRQARAIRTDATVHFREMQLLHSAQAAPNEMESTVNDYIRKYPKQDNRYQGKYMLAHAYLRAKNTARALALFRELVYVDATYGGNASQFVSHNGSEPAKVADSERVLRDAISKNPKDAAYLRYTLAFSIYRDRLKDEAKTRNALRELVTLSADNSSYTTNAISWLFSNAPDDGVFAQEVDRVLKSRRASLHYDRLRNYPAEWGKSYRKHKDLKKRAQLLGQKLQAADNEPLMRAYLQQVTSSRRQGASARQELLSKHFNALSEPAAKYVANSQAYYYRHYASPKQRSECAVVWAKYLSRFPKDEEAAAAYLICATDYSPPEVHKEAALSFLKFPPTRYSSNLARRLFLAADSNKDPQLARRAYDWMKKARQATLAVNKAPNAIDPSYASYFGDTLLKYDMKNEALQVWREHIDQFKQHYESRECAWRLYNQLEENQKRSFLEGLVKTPTPFHGRYSSWLADLHLKEKRFDAFIKTLVDTGKIHSQSPLQGWDFDTSFAYNWINQFRQDEEADPAQRDKVLSVIRDLELTPTSALANLMLLELEPKDKRAPIARLLEIQKATRSVGDQYWGWDPLAPFAQAALARKDFVESATLATGMLANIPSVDARRKEGVQKIVSASYARMGAVGLTIDESSPLAPLLQSALYLRLGDRRLAFDMYQSNKSLFDEHRNELPVDLLVFICETLTAAGGDENFDYVEDVLRTWMVKHSESKQVDDSDKGRMQLLLARNYFRARRFDIARSEFTTVINRYPETAEALDAEFGVGETFMEQKVFDQAERVFEKLSQHSDTRTMVRADFLRGVLFFRKGDRDEARDVFRTVLERVPDVELANQTLFNLAEVYRVEERYVDQLSLLRTVGRLGQKSKRRHNPGTPLSIVVHDSDLGISRGHNKIPVLVRTEPGGDKELVFLASAGAGRGLFRFDLETQLGTATAGDDILQVMGGDVVHCDYPEQFKSEFRNVPLSDVEISMAASAEFEVASSRIEDEEQQTFSQQLTAETSAEDADQRVSQIRPSNQIKPGNPIYIRIKDSDRDLTDKPDTVVVKVATDSGDEVQLKAEETDSHSGVFEAALPSGELPAGALATDSAIDHGPVMAIDEDPATYWQSQPDGATPKQLTVDMKDLFPVSRVRVSTPSREKGAPVRGELQGSYDGEFWFRLAAYPNLIEAQDVSDEFGVMTQRVFRGNYTSYSTWQQVVSLTRNSKPNDESKVEQLQWSRDPDDEDSAGAYAVVWFGKFVQPDDGAIRFAVNGAKTALSMDGILELPPGRGGRTVDLWLEKGVHELTVFSAVAKGNQLPSARRARARLDSDQVVLSPFHADDFDLESPAATAVAPPPQLNAPAIELTAEMAKLHKESEKFAIAEKDGAKWISNWSSNDDVAEWEFDCTRAGVYEVVVDYSHSGSGGAFDLQFGSQALQGAIGNTGSWDKYEPMIVGFVLVEAPGRQTLSIQPNSIAGGALMNLRNVSLRPSNDAVVIALGSEWEFRFPEKELRYTRIVAHEYLGESVAVNHVEVGHAQKGKIYIPTEVDILSLANNDTLEIAAGDTVTATYTDDQTQTLSGTSRLLTRQLTATYNNGSVSPIGYDYAINTSGVTGTLRKDLMRVDPGEEIVVEIVDYDRDTTVARDNVAFEVFVNDGKPITLRATETEENTGVFTRKIFTDAEKQEVDGEEGAITLKVAEGDVVYLQYVDEQNTFPGHAVPRRTEVFVNQPSDAEVHVLPSTVIAPPEGSTAKPRFSYASTSDDDPDAPTHVAFAAPLTIEVIDPDSAKDSRSRVVVRLVTTDGAAVDVECVISDDYWENAPRDIDNAALREGRFVGQVLMQLGGKDSPVVTPLTQDMPRGLLGRAKEASDEEEQEDPDSIIDNLIVHVLNLSGKDIIKTTYHDERRQEGKSEDLTANAKLVSMGSLRITDREYEDPIDRLHVGEKLYLLVTDPDQDVSNERDFVAVEITTTNGEKETVNLSESTVHSGVFTGSYLLKAVESPTPGNASGSDAVIESYFGDSVRAAYADSASPLADPVPSFMELPVVVGTDGLVSAFTKTFNDESLAVETKFRIAESYFELFKSHRDLKRGEDEKTDLESGRRILKEVMEDYPDPKYAPRVAYLLAQFSQELGEWTEAIRSYEMIIQQYPENSLVPDARYKLAQCHEESGDFDEALEAYVTLAATHPKSPLIASVMIRISNYFFKNKNFEIAAQVGEKFLERFDGNQHAPKIAFLVGQCYYKDEKYAVAGQAFDRFAKLFPEDALGADSLFWSGESYRLGRNNREAFRRYNRCRWDYPASEVAKYARGRLALPEMLQQFEAEANSIDQDN